MCTASVYASGVFLIYAGVTGCALFFFHKCVPETKGTSLAEVQMLFAAKCAKAQKGTVTLEEG